MVRFTLSQLLHLFLFLIALDARIIHAVPISGQHQQISAASTGGDVAGSSDAWVEAAQQAELVPQSARVEEGADGASFLDTNIEDRMASRSSLEFLSSPDGEGRAEENDSARMLDMLTTNDDEQADISTKRAWTDTSDMEEDDVDQEEVIDEGLLPPALVARSRKGKGKHSGHDSHSKGSKKNSSSSQKSRKGKSKHKDSHSDSHHEPEKQSKHKSQKHSESKSEKHKDESSHTKPKKSHQEHKIATHHTQKSPSHASHRPKKVKDDSEKHEEHHRPGQQPKKQHRPAKQQRPEHHSQHHSVHATKHRPQKTVVIHHVSRPKVTHHRVVHRPQRPHYVHTTLVPVWYQPNEPAYAGPDVEPEAEEETPVEQPKPKVSSRPVIVPTHVSEKPKVVRPKTTATTQRTVTSVKAISSVTQAKPVKTTTTVIAKPKVPIVVSHPVTKKPITAPSTSPAKSTTVIVKPKITTPVKGPGPSVKKPAAPVVTGLKPSVKQQPHTGPKPLPAKGKPHAGPKSVPAKGKKPIGPFVGPKHSPAKHAPAKHAPGKRPSIKQGA
ncbi:unnamed protein product, partial [Tilletia caries]